MADRYLSFTGTAPGRFLTRRPGLDEPQHVIGVGDHRHAVRRDLDGGGAHAGGELALGVGRDGLVAVGGQEPAPV